MNFFAKSKYGACCMKQDVESRVMLDTHKCNKYGNLYMSSIIWLETQLFEEACFVDLCLVDGFVHQYVRVHGDIHMMWIFFSLKEKNDVFSVWWFCLWQDVTRFCEGPLLNESLMIKTYSWESNGSASLFWKQVGF